MTQQLSCHNYKYSVDWDIKLNYILKNYTKVSRKNKYQLMLKVPSGSVCFGLVQKFDTYTVWVGNRNCAYGYLCELNGRVVPDELYRSPSMETLQYLYTVDVGCVGSTAYDQFYK